MNKFSIRARLKSFVYASRGILLCISKEHNAWIHSGITILVIIAGFYFHITKMEWIAILFCIGLVFAAEIINTAIEQIVNFVSPEYNSTAGKIKDLAAGAVLVCAITAALIGLLIFIPRITEIFL